MAFRKAAGWNSLRNGVWLPRDVRGELATITAGVGGGGGEEPPAPTAPFDFELMNQDGSTAITTVPNLRILVSGDPAVSANWYPLGSVPGHPGLTLARGADGQSLVISGWAGGTPPAGLQVHLKQRIPGEPNPGTGVAGVITELFAKRVSTPAPQNPATPGAMAISPTYYLAPVGVT